MMKLTETLVRTEAKIKCIFNQGAHMTDILPLDTSENSFSQAAASYLTKLGGVRY